MHRVPPEFRLLAHLVAHTGKVLTHRSLLREGWVPRTSRVAITCESAWQVAAEARGRPNSAGPFHDRGRVWAIGSCHPNNSNVPTQVGIESHASITVGRTRSRGGISGPRWNTPRLPAHAGFRTTALRRRPVWSLLRTESIARPAQIDSKATLSNEQKRADRQEEHLRRHCSRGRRPA